MSWGDFWIVALGALFYAVLIAWLLWSTFRRRRAGRSIKLRATLAAYFLLAVLIPFPVGVPLLAPWALLGESRISLVPWKFRTVGETIGSALDPSSLQFVVSAAFAHWHNRTLLDRTDLRRIILEYRVKKAEAERIFTVEMVCFERHSVSRLDFGRPNFFRNHATIVVREPATSSESVSAHVSADFPNKHICWHSAELPLGEQRSSLTKQRSPFSKFDFSVYIISRDRDPRPLVAHFYVADDPISIEDITVHPPIVVRVEMDARLTREEFNKYATPFDLDDENPAIIDTFRNIRENSSETHLPTADFKQKSRNSSKFNPG